MEARVWYTATGWEIQDLSLGIELLKEGYCFKFVYCLSIDIETEVVTLNLLFGKGTQEHENLIDTLIEHLHKQFGEKAALIFFRNELGKENGGEIELQGSTCRFFGSSNKFGPYREDMLQRVEEHLKKLFGASAVIYESDWSA